MIVLWHKWLYFKTMRMQGRLTLHVRRLVHISQVSSVFLKGQCQCSCTDTLTKILIPCRYENVLCSVGDIFHCVGFNNNQFFDNLKRASAFTDARFSVYYLSNLMSNHLSRYSVCKRYAKICGGVFGRKTAQLPKMSFTITKKAMRYQDELHNLPIWVMSFC